MSDLTPQQFTVTRADLVRYAGASGDFNPIHYSERVATSVGLPGVIAHGMFTLALAARAVEEWAGGPDRVVEFGAKFTKPVIVPDNDEGVVIDVSGKVTAEDDATRSFSVSVTCDGVGVLGAMKAVVRV
ncbi:MaoC/PaaZ C-terminal domain-containing protein [Nocardioides sp. Bht2]|uniref:MaoC/PaaZ C-terminal domain-containing protein n=1 Tax=Nocardioides sp. Bht2 TaxID=3392297 RepID=UPI0039B3B406